MKRELTKLVKHGGVYALGMILSRLVSFIMIPIYTRYLCPEDYGTLELLNLTIDLISILIGAGVASAMFRFYYKYSDIRDRREVISTGFIFVLITFSAAFIFLFNITPIISRLIFSTVEFSYYLRLMFITMLLSAGFEIPMAYLRVQQKSLTFISISLFRLIMQLSLNIYFLIYLGMGVLGVLYSSIITSMLTSAYLTITTFYVVRFRFSLSKAKEMISYGFPLIFALLAGFILNFADRYLLNHFSTLKQVGIYTLGYKFGWIICLLVLTPFNNIWAAQKFEIANMDDSQQIYSRVFTFINCILITFAGCICVAIKEIVMIVTDPSYWDCYLIVPFILFAYTIYAWFSYTNIGLHLKYKTKYLAYVSVLAAAANIVLNYLFIPIWGAYGAASATIISFFIRFFPTYVISIKLYPIRYDWARIISYMFLIMVAVFILFRVSSPWIIATVAIKVFLFLIVSLPLILFVLLRPSERKLILGFVCHSGQLRESLLKLRRIDRT